MKFCRRLIVAALSAALPSLVFAQTETQGLSTQQSLSTRQSLSTQSDTAPASAEWSLLTQPSQLTTKKRSRDRSAPETTQSIGRKTPVAIEQESLLPGWNLSSDETSARLIYSVEGKPTPVGFTCKKGDGFVTFRSPSASQAAGKKVLVLLKSKNGAIRIESRVSAEGDKVLASEIPVRTSSLVFVLTPKKGEAKLNVGGWSTEIPEGASDIKLLRFQTMCDQAVAANEAE